MSRRAVLHLGVRSGETRKRADAWWYRLSAQSDTFRPDMGALIFVAGFFIALAGLVMFAAMRRGPGTAITKTEPSREARRLTTGMVAVVAVGMGIAVPAAVMIGNETVLEGPGNKELTADQHEGRQLFADKCATCHTLEDARAVGKVGPDLDVRILPAKAIETVILEGRAAGRGQMPKELFNGEDAKHVAEYVEYVAGR